MKLQPQIINEFPPYPKLSIKTYVIDMSEEGEKGLIHTKTTISSRMRLLRDGVYYLLDVATCYEIFGEHREECLKNAMEEFTRDAYVASILHETVEFMDKDQASEKERITNLYIPNVNKAPDAPQPERSEGDTCKCKPRQRICTPPRKSNINKIKKCGNCGKPLPKRFQPPYSK